MTIVLLFFRLRQSPSASGLRSNGNNFHKGDLMARPSKLSAMKEKLLSRRNQIFEAHRALRQDLETLGQPEPEYEGAGQKEDISDVLSRLDSREKEELEHIDDILGRIEAGSYGICQSCGKKISPKRLEAIPWQTLCRACEKKREKQGPSPSPKKKCRRGPQRFPKASTTRRSSKRFRIRSGKMSRNG